MRWKHSASTVLSKARGSPHAASCAAILGAEVVTTPCREAVNIQSIEPIYQTAGFTGLTGQTVLTNQAYNNKNPNRETDSEFALQDGLEPTTP